ncbi:UNVERIFIED_CONTAM: hypothetical protein GTU68_046183 [Idotea baltica]|nr:hypothetical protein [Idotea baltica]
MNCLTLSTKTMWLSISGLEVKCTDGACVTERFTSLSSILLAN